MKKLNFFKLLLIVVVFVLLFASEGFCTITSFGWASFSETQVSFPDKIFKGKDFWIYQLVTNKISQYSVKVSTTIQYKHWTGIYRSLDTYTRTIKPGKQDNTGGSYALVNWLGSNYVTFRVKVIESLVNAGTSKSFTYYTTEVRVPIN